MARVGILRLNRHVPDYILVQDEKSSGINGGQVTSVSTWLDRDLTIERVDTGNHATLSGNRVGLLAGTYRYLVSAPGVGVYRHQIRLYNHTDAAVVSASYGTCEYIVSGSSRSIASGQFVITATKQIGVQHIFESGGATTDLGYALGSTAIEVYTKAEFWRMPL